MLPVLLIGAAAVAGLTGLGAGGVAARDAMKAKAVLNEAQQNIEKRQAQVRSAAERADENLNALGRVKLRVAGHELKRVVAVANRVHTGEDNLTLDVGRKVAYDPVTVEDMEVAAFRATDLLKSGVSGVSAGASAGIGAFGIAGTIGTASSGTAISSLSGVAATNATWAWLGGGSISAGGAGMAGGMMAMAGIVAGPAIAVTGITAAIAASKNLTKAQEHAAEIDIACEKLRTAIACVNAVGNRADQVRDALVKMGDRTRALVAKAELMLDAKAPAGEKVAFASLTEAERNLYKMVLMAGQALYQLIEVDVADESGHVTAASAAAVQAANDLAAGATGHESLRGEPA